jgi:hypothetical protein
VLSGIVAAAGSVAVIACTAGASANLADAADPDAELRRLWALYQERCAAEQAAHAAFLPIWEAWSNAHTPRRFRSLEASDASYNAWPGLREADDALRPLQEECERIREAIRAAEASTLFGIGVKLAVVPEEEFANDYEEAVNDALRQIARLTGERTFADVAEELWAWDDTSPDEEEDETRRAFDDCMDKINSISRMIAEEAAA